MKLFNFVVFRKLIWDFCVYTSNFPGYVWLSRANKAIWYWSEGKQLICKQKVYVLVNNIGVFVTELDSK